MAQKTLSYRYEESDTLKGFDFVYDAHGNHFDP